MNYKLRLSNEINQDTYEKIGFSTLYGIRIRIYM